MPSNTLAAFAAGLFVATLVLTHDASAGTSCWWRAGSYSPRRRRPSTSTVEERLDGQIRTLSGRAGRPDAPEGTKATDHPDGEAIDATRVSDASDAIRRPQPRRSRDARPARSPRSRRARARAGRVAHHDAARARSRRRWRPPRLALRLWASRAVPRQTRWSTACARGPESSSRPSGVSCRWSRTTNPRRTPRSSSPASPALEPRAGVALLRQEAPRAVTARARAALARQRRRARARAARAVAPFVAVARRVASASRSARRRRGWERTSRPSLDAAAARAAVMVAASAAWPIAALPHWARAFVRKREIVASATLLVPTFFTVNALERVARQAKA